MALPRKSQAKAARHLTQPKILDMPALELPIVDTMEAAMPHTGPTDPAVPKSPPEAPAPDLFAAPPPAPKVANIRELKQPASRTGIGAKAAKPGYGLVMRAPDGEDSMTPFRSLDDLLSAVKPILRAAVRSPEAVWFSIQPVDLASIDLDVA